MRVVALSVLVLCSTASAQPGAQPAPPPQTYPAPPVYGPPQPYQPAYAIPLTRDEYALLARGEISDGAQLGGGLAALFFGFGTGQAIQGRWGDTGYIFTLGEGATTALMIAGMVRMFEDCVHVNDVDKDCEHSDGPVLLI